MNKPTLLYTAGSYGALLLRILNQAPPIVSQAYHTHAFTPLNTEPNRQDHHLIREADINGQVIKITYTNEDVKLINRNKWQKVDGHLKEQSMKTFPNHPHREIYTMAIHVINLLGDNHFKTVNRSDTIEFKFSNFLQPINGWCTHFKEIFDRLRIKYNEKTIKDYFKAFQEGQKDILNQHKQNNDDIFLSYMLGKEYFALYSNNYNQNYFDIVFEKIRR